MSPAETFPGLVIRQQSGYYTVQTESGKVICHLRGRLKQRTVRGDIATIGDRVKITILPDGTGSIEGVEERKCALVRLDPTPRGEFRQILLANPDQIVLVFSCAKPEPHLRMLDRFLVVCERQGIPAVIVANKVDLVGLEKARYFFAAYQPVGYPVLFTSVKSGLGVEDLHQRLSGKISGLAGPSGVGKSSLLNAIQPELGLVVREISRFTSKGQHTTNVRQLFPLESGGFVADLPGIRSLALWDINPEELDGYFPELGPLVGGCQFNDCTHQDEPGCAVRKAVEQGKVHPDRYQSYLRLRFGED
jgi:ribosome biogenesis GTPase